MLLNLCGPWEMRRVGDAEWLPAAVPGSVYADLLRLGKMEDPFYRENEAACTAVSDDDYEYRRSFEVSDELLAHDRVLLRCEGLDTLCDLTLNGGFLTHTENMHRTYEIDVRGLLHPGENTISAVFRSPNRFAAQAHRELPLDVSNDALHGFSHLRKAQCMFGWDWGPKLPDMGIWRGISLVGWDKARLADVYVEQEHAGDGVVLRIRLQAEIFGAAQVPTVKVRIAAPDGGVTAVEGTLQNGRAVLSATLRDPQLWWPNGMGAQPLYEVSAALFAGETALDERRMRIGLRTLTVKTEPDGWGTSFAFCVNGTPFFAKGGDYIPEDNILSRVTPERSRRLLEDCVKANYNMVRVWGGGYYPDDSFYDTCDELGLVVWQDLAYACAAYHFTDSFRDNIAAETADNVRRIRHHACLGLWCGNNEMEEGWVYWKFSERFGPHLRADYIRQFEEVLPRLVHELDPQTFYWRSSPSSGGDFDDPDDESRGDRHYWGVWHGLEPFTEYRNHYPRFMSEYGIQSFPCLKTVESFTVPEDRNIFSPVMEAHQKNSTANGKILYYISENYRYPKDFDALLYVSQLIQAEGVRYAIEHMRQNRGRCMGSLVWQINDCWPVASWSSIDYFGRWKALHYIEKRAYAPVLVSAREEGAKVELHLANDRREALAGILNWRLLDADSRAVQEGSQPVQVPALSAALCRTLDFSGQLGGTGRLRSCVLCFSFSERGREVSRGMVLFVKPKHFDFCDPKIVFRVEEGDGVYRIRVRAAKTAKNVELLPQDDAVFSDNFFDLAGGEEYTVEAPRQAGVSAAQFEAGLRVRSLYDSFAHC